jgi:hypothetical protein
MNNSDPSGPNDFENARKDDEERDSSEDQEDSHPAVSREVHNEIR